MKKQYFAVFCVSVAGSYLMSIIADIRIYKDKIQKEIVIEPISEKEMNEFYSQLNKNKNWKNIRGPRPWEKSQ